MSPVLMDTPTKTTEKRISIDPITLWRDMARSRSSLTIPEM